MAALDESIFRKRAIDKYVHRRELQVILRLVSPSVFVSLWILLLLAVCAGVLVGSVQQPVLVQGKGIVMQQPQKVNNKTNVMQTVVLLLLPLDQQASLKVGQPVTIDIAASNITFKSTITSMEAGVMSPAAISKQFNVQASLMQAISGPSVVAIASIQQAPMSQTYVGSQCQVQVEIGSQSALSLVPGFDGVSKYLTGIANFFNNLPAPFDNMPQKFNNFLQKL
jgi:hypothetical protein